MLEQRELEQPLLQAKLEPASATVTREEVIQT